MLINFWVFCRSETSNPVMSRQSVGGNMDDLLALLDQPTRLRQKLLLKALETKPMAEALELVKAVEAFLTEPTRSPSAPIH